MTTDTKIRDKYVDVDGLKIRYLEEGAGAPVILLHGASLGSSADVFERNLGPLAAYGIRPIACDFPGCGLSDIPADHSMAYRRQFVLNFMDALGLKSAAIIGHSQAGGNAVDLAFSNPDRITKVVVLGNGGILPPLPEGAAGGPAEGREGTATEPTIDDTRKLLEANLFHHELITDEVLALRHSRSLGKPFEAFVARGQVREKKTDGNKVPLSERLDQCPAPLLLIYGAQDRGQAAKRFAILRERYPTLDAHLIDGCKHLVPWDAAEAYVKLAGPFLAG